MLLEEENRSLMSDMLPTQGMLTPVLDRDSVNTSMLAVETSEITREFALMADAEDDEGLLKGVEGISSQNGKARNFVTQKRPDQAKTDQKNVSFSNSNSMCSWRRGHAVSQG